MKRILSVILGLIVSYAPTSAQAGLPPTTSKGSGDSTDITTFKFRFPNFTVTHSGTLATFNVLGIAGGGTGATTANGGFAALSPQTTKGDLISFSTVPARLAVGSDGQMLTADSTQATGVKWSTVALSIQFARVVSTCSASPCTLQQNSSGITSITRSATGTYNIVFAGGTFSNSSGPVCNISPFGTTVVFGAQGTTSGTHNATNYGFTTYRADTFAITDSFFDIICTGS